MSWKSVIPAVVATVLVGGGVAMAAEAVPTDQESVPAEEITPSSTATPTQGEGSEDDSEGTGSEGTESPEAKPASDEASAESEVVAPECPEGVRNHGEYVSGVAKSEERRELRGADRGALMAAAAKDACGKPDKDADESPEATELEQSEDDDSDDVKPQKGPKADKKSAKGNNGKGKGKSGRS